MKFSKKGSGIEIRIETLKNRLNPALIVVEDGSPWLVANFKDDASAKYFIKMLSKLTKWKPEGK